MILSNAEIELLRASGKTVTQHAYFKDLPKYEVACECKKCLGDKFRLYYSPEKREAYPVSDFEVIVAVYEEHMVRVCANCGYMFYTACADSK
jgi:hypothetical protein